MVDSSKLKVENISNGGELRVFGHDTEIIGKKLQGHQQE